MEQCQEERSQGQGVCQTLSRQAEECKISGEEADGAAGSPGIYLYLLSFVIRILNEQMRGTASADLVSPCYRACCESHGIARKEPALREYLLI